MVRPRREPARDRWRDSLVPILLSGDGGLPPQPDAATVREIHAFLAGCRATAGLGEEPFDLVMSGTTPAGPAAAADLAGSLGQPGTTWWAGCLWGDLESAGPIIRRTERGPAARISGPASP